MTPKSEAAAAERKVMDRYEARLDGAMCDALAQRGEMEVIGQWRAAKSAAFTLKILRASAAALYPGDQQRKHLLPALGKMVTAACRVIRRSGR